MMENKIPSAAQEELLFISEKVEYRGNQLPGMCISFLDHPYFPGLNILLRINYLRYLSAK